MVALESQATDAGSTPTIYVLLPVHNRRALTERFARCLAAQTWSAYHLLLIDDGSTDGTSYAVAAIVPSLTVLKGRGRWWWGGSLDQGLAWLRARTLPDDTLVLFINDDLAFEPDYLERAVRVMRERPQTLVLSQRVAPGGGTPIETGQHVDLHELRFSNPQRADDINCLSTQGLFARWTDIRALGGFHPRLLPHYLSDYEYTIRAYRRGLACTTSPELLIDLNAETTGFHVIQEKRFNVFLRKFFSLKSPSNPIFFTTFACMVCPRERVVPIVLRIWRDALRAIAQAFRSSQRATRAAVR